MADLVSKVKSTTLVSNPSDKTEVNKALYNTVDNVNNVVDALNSFATTTNGAIASASNGSITEMGTNSNGTYIKWGNGLLICIGITANVQTSAATGSVFQNSILVTFPETFVNLYSVSLSASYVSGYVWPGDYESLVTTGMRVHISGSSSSATGKIGYTVIGTWK